MEEPLSYNDYYTKSDMAEHIADKTLATFIKWEKDGKVFSPRFKKSSSTNARSYYSLADAMRISIILYNAIQMERIYNLVLKDYPNPLKAGEASNIMLSHYQGNGVGKKEIKESLEIVKQDIVTKKIEPVDLSPFLIQSA